jgi:hypothetical protein
MPYFMLCTKADSARQLAAASLLSHNTVTGLAAQRLQQMTLVLTTVYGGMPF